MYENLIVYERSKFLHEFYYKRTSWLIEKRDNWLARGLGCIRMNGKLKAPIRWRNAAEGAASGSVIQKIQK